MRLESYEGSDEDGSDGSGGSTDGTKPAGLAISSLTFISAMAKSEASWSCSKTASLMRSAPEKTLISKGSPSGQRRRKQCRLPSEPHSKIGALLNGETDMKSESYSCAPMFAVHFGTPVVGVGPLDGPCPVQMWPQSGQ